MRRAAALVRTRACTRSSGPNLGSFATWLAAGALCFSGATLHGQGATFIRDATLIDGTDGEARPHIDILIRHGRISAIAPSGSIRAPEGAMLVDAAGKTVLPGIVNLRGLAGLVRSPVLPQDHFSQDSISRHLASYASYGVAATATLAPQPAQLRAAQADARTARVLTPVRAICAAIPRGARGTALEAAFEQVRTPQQAWRAVDTLAQEGAHFIEFHDSGHAAEAGELIELAVATLQRASHRKLPTMVVTHRATVALAAVRSGARVIAASINDAEIGADFVIAAVASGTTYAPALFAEAAGFAYEDRPEWIDDRYLRRSLPSGITGQLRGPVQVVQALDPDLALKRRRFDTARRNLRKLAAAGVPVALASGSGFPLTFEGYGEYREAVLMSEAGLSAADVIKAFSSGSAEALGIGHELGAILPGHRADLVILNASPLDNIHNLRDLHAVFVGGALMRL